MSFTNLLGQSKSYGSDLHYLTLEYLGYIMTVSEEMYNIITQCFQ